MLYKPFQAPILLALFLFVGSLPLLAEQKISEDNNKNAELAPGLQEFQQARHYLLGQSVKQNRLKACELFLQAAKLGIPVAMQQSGHCYRDSILVPTSDAIGWYQKSIAAGLAGAQCDIGALFFMGKGVKQDKPRGIKLCTLAAEVGAVSAKATLGHWYNQDADLKDIQQAQHWLEQAAPYHGESAYLLAQLIENYSNKHEVALYWYETSASLGYLPAYKVVAQAYVLSIESNQDKAEPFLAKAYIWSQAWQARVKEEPAQKWIEKIFQQTPIKWHPALNVKVAEHVAKF